jgi:hypothetical protein
MVARPRPREWWQRSFTTEGQTYPYAMVGTDPAAGPVTTNVTVKIIPLRLTFDADGQVMYDPGMVSDTLASPVFTPVDVGLGPLQWHDLIQHISLAAPAGWHVRLIPQTLPTQDLTVGADQGFTVQDPVAQRRLGIVNIAWSQRKAQQLIASLHIKPTELAVFLTYNTIGSLTSAADCVSPQGCHTFAAWHDRILTGGKGPLQPPKQVNTLIWSTWRDLGAALPPGVDFASEPLSHEVIEWAADPFLANVVPQWQGVFIGASHPCQELLEAADPVEQLPIGVPLPDGRLTAMTNAVTLSWFARESPSRALFGLYDLTGTITEPSSPCG